MSTLSVKVINDVTSVPYVDNSLAAANAVALSAQSSVGASFNTANAAFNAANNVNLGPVFTVANASFAKANTALQNTSGTFAGNFTLTTGNSSFGTSTYYNAKLQSFITDGVQYSGLFSGTSKGVRLTHSTYGSLIDGTDFTGSGSYQPLYIGGANLNFTISGSAVAGFTSDGHLIPYSSNTYDLGSSTARWRNIYTGDLHLSNEFGNWTIVEGEDELFLYNNLKDKVYKFNLTEVDPSTAPPKKGV